MLAQVRETVLSLGNRRNLTNWNPPQHEMWINSLKPLSAAAEQLSVPVAIHEVGEIIDRFPHRPCDNHLPIEILLPPDESRGHFGDCIDRVELRDEVRQQL